MRLQKLCIPSYGNLRNFEVDFNNEQPTVLIGRNGSGKSYLFEAIVEIFRDLELGRTPDFAYTLEYTCRERSIKLDADPARPGRRFEAKVDGNVLTQSAFKRELDNLLPNYVFAYYSGWSERLERHFRKSTRRYYENVLNSNGTDMPLRRMFFCRKEYSQLVLLAFFFAEPESTRQLLKQYLGIKGFDSALFVLKTPWWGGGNPNRVQQREGDARFWYARGAFRGFLDRLWDKALAPVRNVEVVDRDVRRKGESIERLYLFIKNQVELSRLMDANEDTKTLFGYLESLFLCDLIDEVRVTVERLDGTRIKFAQLSEGEQQLLTVLGLLLFTQNDESLYLLDEPDTHLNPIWTYGYLKLLQENIRAEKGQLLITTHNPLMVGSLRKKQVRVLRQDDQAITAEEPEYDPIGIGIEGLLKSELYGLRSTLPLEILEKLDRHYQLLGKDSNDMSEEEQTELMQLANDLNQLGVSRTHPNPYFEHFANAMARHIPVSEVALSKQEINSQARLADEVLAEVLGEEMEEQQAEKREGDPT